ncbi:MAG: hypothetical protein IJ087_06550, partial [Eggerthellaceae bacterium]|nr:hypothetical protein [Eggerthellaceae bacterium]
HNKKVYKGIMKNRNFIKTLKKVDAKYSSVIEENNRLQVETAAESWKTTLKSKKTGEYGGYMREYNLYAKELNKPRYRAIEKKLGLKNVKLRDPDTLLVETAKSQSGYTAVKANVR